MPNLNVKGDAPRPGGAPASSGGGVPKIAIIIIVVIAVLGATAFILNTMGIVKLWGKKKPTPQVVSLPQDNYQPVTQDTAVSIATEPEPAPDLALTPEENKTIVETSARKGSKKETQKNIVRGTGMYTIQISSWPAREKAENQAQLFADAGYDSFTEPLGSYYRVCVGRFETKADAKSQMEKMEHMLESMPVVAKIGK